jgi:hypothetical protein
MANATIKLLSNDKMGEFYFTKDQVATAKAMIAEGLYSDAGSFFVSEDGEAAAEVMFDMTNNPAREYERAKYYSRGRSVSVGDIIEVDGVNYLCCSCGWEIV